VDASGGAGVSVKKKRIEVALPLEASRVPAAQAGEGDVRRASKQAIRQLVRQSLGYPPDNPRMLPMEGHVCDFPLWSYSKKRVTTTSLHIAYEDGTFCTLRAPHGMPGPSFPGYLDCMLYHGQRDIFVQEYVEVSVYAIFQTLGINPNNGGNYANFRRDMRRAFALSIETDRFRNPQTGRRSHVEYFHILRRMSLAKQRQEVSAFFFDDLFLASLRAGYLKRLDFDFCLHLDKNNAALARFLYSHILKRLGTKSIYMRRLLGFLHDVGLGYMATLPPKIRNQKVKQTLYPALETLRGQGFTHWERDDDDNIVFLS
jgi:hypothetical protein